MKKYKIEIAMAVLGIAFLVAITIQFLNAAHLVEIWWTIASDVIIIAIYMIITSVVLVTNTRRPAGIDPNEASPKLIDPFALPTEELWHEGMPDRRQMKRRATDLPDPATVTRLIEHFKEEDAERPMTDKTPQWALDLQQEHGEET